MCIFSKGFNVSIFILFFLSWPAELNSNLHCSFFFSFWFEPTLFLLFFFHFKLKWLNISLYRIEGICTLYQLHMGVHCIFLKYKFKFIFVNPHLTKFKTMLSCRCYFYIFFWQLLNPLLNRHLRYIQNRMLCDRNFFFLGNNNYRNI